MLTLQSPYLAEIFTDQPIYAPGSQVTGRVVLTLKRKLHLDRLLINLRGEVNVKFELKPDIKELLGYRRSNSPTNPVEYKNHLQLCNETVVLWSQMNAVKEAIRRASKNSSSSSFDSDFSCPQGLEAGVYKYNFAFQLPDSGLYTSFDAKGSPANVKYTIEVLSQYGDAEILRGETLVAVVCPEILTLDKPNERQSFVQTKQISKSELLTVQLNLKRTKFLPCDAIEGEIIIHNKTKRSVKYALLNVKNKLSCFSETPQICRYDHDIKEHGMGLAADKVCAGKSFSYPIQLNIPALVPQINVPNCLFTSYKLQLNVGFLRNSPNATVLSLNIPIEIGTELLELTTAELPFAPPAYDEILVQ